MWNPVVRRTGLAAGAVVLIGWALTCPADEPSGGLGGTPLHVHAVGVDFNVPARVLNEVQATRPGGQYSRLLRTIAVPQDRDVYGDFYDWGFWSGTSWAGYTDLPPGYWVYVYPNWYIFGESAVEVLSRPLTEKRPWGPEQATGEPDTHQAGDIATAWASRSSDGQAEWLRLHYAQAVVPSAIHVYQSYNPGALVRITARKADGQEVELWSGTAQADASGEVVVARIGVKADFPTDCITLHLDSPAVSSWNEIDAVGLLDQQEKVQWATSAEASSTFAEYYSEGYYATGPSFVVTDNSRLERLEAEVNRLRNELDALRAGLREAAK